MKEKPSKIKPHEFSGMLHDVFEEERAQKLRQQQKISIVLYKLRRAITIPAVIGIAAAIFMWYVFGVMDLLKTLLSWTIGLTILAAVVSLLERVDNNH